MGWSAEARAAAAEARRLKPKVHSTELARTRPPRLPKLPKPKPVTDARTTDIARSFPNLSDRGVLSTFSRQARKPARSKLETIARLQAHEGLSNASLVEHYKSGVFKRRGVGPEEVKRLRDAYHNGEKIPLWAAPPGTPIALYADSTSTVPDLIGSVIAHSSRRPLEDSGRPMKIVVPYVHFRDETGQNYEYPAALGGGPHSPHVGHPSFAAIDSIVKGQDYIPQLGFSGLNFWTGDNKGPSGSPKDLELLAKNIQRAVNFAQAVQARKDRAKK